MTNNDVLRRLRYIFDLSDKQMMAVFALAGRPSAHSIGLTPDWNG